MRHRLLSSWWPCAVLALAVAAGCGIKGAPRPPGAPPPAPAASASSPPAAVEPSGPTLSNQLDGGVLLPEDTVDSGT